MSFEGTCFYCLSEASRLFSCVNSCLNNSNIQPSFPAEILAASVALTGLFLFLALYFRYDIKKTVGFRLAGIASFSTAVFTVGLVFGGHFILKSLPWLIPSAGIGSYLISYFFSFYLVKKSYKSVKMENEFSDYLKKLCKNLKVKVPSLHVFLSKEPKAFVVDGFKKAIFLSDSLIDRLDEKSIKAVLLHEVYHLKRRSGILKNLVSSFANLNFRIIPVPIDELEKREEEEIDKIILKRHGADIQKIKDRLWA